jgi:hypothetical protein
MSPTASSGRRSADDSSQHTSSEQEQQANESLSAAHSTYSQPLQRPSAPNVSGIASGEQSADYFLKHALLKIGKRAQRTIEDLLPKGYSDVDSALSIAYNFARERQKQCEAKRWKVNFAGRHVTLRDEADKILAFLDKFKAAGDVAVNSDPIHAGIPWAGIRMLLEVKFCPFISQS